MHPREGKYTHAAQFGLRTGIAGRQLPVGVLVCNLPEAPALLEAGDVSTFFHEFGHLMHTLFAGRQKWYPFAGLSTEWDFVEAPSQLLEEWMADPAVLRRFARHHETGEPIPEELVRKMRRSEEWGKGLQNRRQMYLAMMSLRLHLSEPGDTLETVKALSREYSPTPFREGTYPHLSFGHLDGYSAIYYTYAWSLVIAKDLLGPFRKRGLMDRATAGEYRRRVLEPGGSRDAAELVESFLGRPYSFDAFRRWLEEGE
jgi:thimet oligopeptidase